MMCASFHAPVRYFISISDNFHLPKHGTEKQINYRFAAGYEYAQMAKLVHLIYARDHEYSKIEHEKKSQGIPGRIQIHNSHT